jgi:hypothetical protein
MSRKTILIAGLLFLAVVAAIVFTMASGVRGNSSPKDAWTLTVTLPATNKGATGTSIGISRPTK